MISQKYSTFFFVLILIQLFSQSAAKVKKGKYFFGKYKWNSVCANTGQVLAYYV